MRILRLAALPLLAAPLSAAEASQPFRTMRHPPVFADFQDRWACEASIDAAVAQHRAEEAAAPPRRWTSIEHRGPALNDRGQLTYRLIRTSRVEEPGSVATGIHIWEYRCEGARRSMVFEVTEWALLR
jgi:hypothetical protein